MEINTTRNPGGGVSTSTMGPEILAGPSAPNPSVGNSKLNDYLDWMMQEKKKQYYAPPPSNQGASATIEQMPQVSRQTRPAQVQQKAPARATRMRRVRRLNSAIPIGMDAAGITYDDMSEYQLPDGSWSLDAVHGTNEGNEDAVREINTQRNLNPTSILPLNMSGGMSVIPPREKK